MSKKILKHYNQQASKFGLNPKSTMTDTSTRNLEMQIIHDKITDCLPSSSSNILDVGCGNGYSISELSKEFPCKFFGIDNNKNMISLAKQRKLEKTIFKTKNVGSTGFKNETFDIIFSQRCLINLDDWKSQQKALSEIHRILKKDGYYIMLECFNDGLENLNSARTSVGLIKIKPAWHNLYFDKKQLIKVFKDKFVDVHSLKEDNYITFDNFLSSYFFGSRVLYPALSAGKKDITYNNGFVKFFSQIPSYGYYSQIQLCVVQKI